MHSLRSRLIAAFLAATMLPLAATIWITASLLDRSLGYATTEELDRLSRTLKSTVRQFYQRERERCAGRRVVAASPSTYGVARSAAWPRCGARVLGERRGRAVRLAGPGGIVLDYMRRTRQRRRGVRARSLGGIRMQELSEELRRTRELVGSIEARDLRRGFTLTLFLLVGARLARLAGAA